MPSVAQAEAQEWADQNGWEVRKHRVPSALGFREYWTVENKDGRWIPGRYGPEVKKYKKEAGAWAGLKALMLSDPSKG